MKVYVSTSSKNPVKDAIDILDRSGYKIDLDGREYFFQKGDAENEITQIYCEDEHGDDTIHWFGQCLGKISSSNKLEVEFSC